MLKTAGLFLLLLLKILGWILLAILFAAAVVLFMVLFVPVRYQAAFENERAQQKPEQGFVKNIRIRLNASWLFRFIHVTVRFDGADGISSRIRAAGIDVQKIRSGRSAKKAAKKSRRAVKSPDESKQEKPQAPEDASGIGSKEADSRARQAQETEGRAQQAQETEGPAQQAQEAENPAQQADTEDPADSIKKEKKGDRKEQPINSRTKQNRKKQKKNRNTKNKNAENQNGPDQEKNGRKADRPQAERLTGRLQQLYRQSADEANRSAAIHLWKEICFLLGHYKPDRLKADLTFSMADPALTGGVLGLVSLFPLLYRYPCSIAADFESEKIYVEGELFLKGKVTGGIFLLSLFRLIRDKNFRNIVRRLTGR